MAREQQRQPQAAFPGVISVHELYTLEEARKRLRWTESALRAARRRGLKLLSCGKRKYVSGKEIVRFWKSCRRTHSSLGPHQAAPRQIPGIAGACP